MSNVDAKISDKKQDSCEKCQLHNKDLTELLVMLNKRKTEQRISFKPILK